MISLVTMTLIITWPFRRCLIPECENAKTAEYWPAWLLSAVPYDGDPPEPAWCERYAVCPHNNTPNCSPDIFLTNLTLACDQWVFENEEKTTVTEVCHYTVSFHSFLWDSYTNSSMSHGLPPGYLGLAAPLTSSWQKSHSFVWVEVIMT